MPAFTLSLSQDETNRIAELILAVASDSVRAKYDNKPAEDIVQTAWNQSREEIKALLGEVTINE